MLIFLLPFLSTLKSTILKDNERGHLVPKSYDFSILSQISGRIFQTAAACKNPEDRRTPAENCKFCALSSERQRGRSARRSPRGWGFQVIFMRFVFFRISSLFEQLSSTMGQKRAFRYQAINDCHRGPVHEELWNSQKNRFCVFCSCPRKCRKNQK